jgi:hypothetical protein
MNQIESYGYTRSGVLLGRNWISLNHGTNEKVHPILERAGFKPI